MAENKNLGIDLELDETVAQGNYSNLAIIAHSTSEFIIDFAAVMPAVPKAKVKSRIILRRISCVTRACTVRSSFLRRSIRATSSAARSAKPDLLAFQPFVVRRRAALRVRTRFGQGRASFRTAVRSGRRSAARMLSLWETWAGTKRNAVRRDLPSHRIFTFGRYALRRGAVCVWPRRLCPPRSRNPTVRSCS